MKYSKLKNKITPGSIVLFSQESKWIDAGLIVNCDYGFPVVIIFKDSTANMVSLDSVLECSKDETAIKILESPQRQREDFDNFALNRRFIEDMPGAILGFFAGADFTELIPPRVHPGYLAKKFTDQVEFSAPIFVNFDIK